MATMLSVVIPDTTASQTFGTDGAIDRVLIDVKPGAAQLIGSQAALALSPSMGP